MPRRGGGRPNRQPRGGGGARNESPSTPPSHNHHNRHQRPTPSSSVPAHSSLLPNKTAVSIVLKQDQPTGRQVQGIVCDILTRGDHPRGVKVRLRDGRVGRVQRLVTEEEGKKGEESVGGAGAGLGRDGEMGGGRRARGGYKHVADVRDEDEYLLDDAGRGTLTTAEGGGWFKALEEADARYEEQRYARGAGRIAMGESGEEDGDGGGSAAPVAKCPVCGEFKGDEQAVAHHVERHFGS